jgi:hypothetical protein
MESDLRPCKRLQPFSERMAARHSDKLNGSFLFPSHGHIQQARDKFPGSTNCPYIHSPDDKEAQRRSLTRPPDHDLEPDLETDSQNSSNFHLLSTVFLPAFIICVPIALLCAALLAIVYFYKVDIRPNSFTPAEPQPDPGYVLVNFPASQYCHQSHFE